MNAYLKETQKIFSDVEKTISTRLSEEGLFFRTKQHQPRLVFIGYDRKVYYAYHHLHKEDFDSIESLYEKISDQEIYYTVADKFLEKMNVEVPEDYFHSIVPYQADITIYGNHIFEEVKIYLNIESLNYKLRTVKANLTKIMKKLISKRGTIFPNILNVPVRVFYDFPVLHSRNLILTLEVKSTIECEVIEPF